MHRAPAAAAPIDFLLPQSNTSFGRQVRSYSQTAAPRSTSEFGHRTHTNSSLGSQNNNLTYENLQKLPVAAASQSKALPGFAEAPVRDGLRTPPDDDMNTTTAYQTQQFPVYRPQDSSYPYAPAQSVQNVVPSISTKHQASTYHREADYNPQQSRSLTAQALSNIGSGSQQSSYGRQSPKNSSTGVLSQADDVSRRKSAILASLQIPSSINNSGGSLGEFAAQVRNYFCMNMEVITNRRQITCLFWFESTPTLQIAEEWTDTDPNALVKRLVPDAIPSVAFRKWVVTILSTTQVTQNVILLALLFIYRLKTLNPKVKGKTGSEYRLLTVALMLGNKCEYPE